MRLPLGTRGSVGETWMETCASGAPSRSRTVDSHRGATRFLQPLYPHEGCTVYQPQPSKPEEGCGGDGGGVGRGGGEAGVLRLRFQPMRLLLTGSSCSEKSPLWSFGPQGGCTTSMGEHSLGCRGDRERERGERRGDRERERERERKRQI